MTDAVGTPRRNLLPVVIGMALTASFLFLLAVLSRHRSGSERTVPVLTLTAPAPGTAVDSPLVVRFVSSHPIALQPTGWGYERLHLHAWVDDIAYMPAAADILAVDSMTAIWTIAVVPRGRHRVQLGWADAAHRELTAGRTDTLTILVR